MIARFHYDRTQLQAFLDDRQSVDPQEIQSHVESCPACQAELETLAQSNFDWEQATRLLSEPVVRLAERHGEDDPKAFTKSATTFLEPTDHPDSLGRFARYEIMELLGRGGMGIVMRGFDTSLNRHSAIKVLAPELASSAAARKRFSREAKSAAAVVHPHVVPIQTVDEHNGLPYLVMPVVEGQSLQQRVDRNGPISVIETVRIAAQVASGLQAAHEQGLVHRDIKPANVLLENGVERVQITDFGLARAIDDASMTRSGVVTGTPQYMSPEQAHGDTIDHRSDLFSLGSLIYFMLAARSPFRAETTMGVLNRIGNDEPRSLRSINAEVPQWLEQIVMKLLAKSRDDRFQSASEVGQLLQDWHAHLQQPEIVKRPTEPHCEPTALAAGSRGGLTKWFIATAAFAFLAFAGVLIILETNKGTLTIQCEADDVPIRIMQGDTVVEQMTVTKGADSVRIASGKYLVEIDGEHDGLVVQNDSVLVTRGGNNIVRVIRTNRTPDATGKTLLKQVFSPMDGIVKEVIVRHDSIVAKGEILLKISNSELSAQLQFKQRKIDELLKELTSGSNLQPPALELEKSRLNLRIAELKTEQQRLKAREAALELKSPVAGRVRIRDVDELLSNRNVLRGQILMEIEVDDKAAELVETPQSPQQATVSDFDTNHSRDLNGFLIACVTEIKKTANFSSIDAAI